MADLINNSDDCTRWRRKVGEQIDSAEKCASDLCMTSSWNCPTALTLSSAKVEPAYLAESGSESPLPAAF